MAPESATQVGHPAPFPVELPQRLIDLYTYRDDLVLDPFVGSGTTAVAAVRTGRRYVGYDTDEGYIAAARTRVAAEVGRAANEDAVLFSPSLHVELGAGPGIADPAGDPVARAVYQGRTSKEVAGLVLRQCGFSDVRPDVRYPGLGVGVSFVARGTSGADWAFEVAGGFTTTRAGLKRADILWKVLGKAAVLHEARGGLPLVLLTTDVPVKGSAGDAALRAVLGPGRAIHDVVELLSAEGSDRLRRYARSARRSP